MTLLTFLEHFNDSNKYLFTISVDGSDYKPKTFTQGEIPYCFLMQKIHIWYILEPYEEIRVILEGGV